MKKFKLFIAIFIFACINGNIVKAADDTANQPLSGDITTQAIEAPLTLQVWTPPYLAVPVAATITTINHFNVLKNIVAPLASGTGMIKKSKPKDKNPDENNRMAQNSNNLNNFGNEEILYNIDFINSPETPVFADTLIFIKIPDWLQYSQESVKFNTKKLTDEEDKDRLTFLPEDRILKISLKNLNLKNKINITFNAKPIAYDVTENTPYCLIKFQSKSKKSEMEWKPFAQ